MYGAFVDFDFFEFVQLYFVHPKVCIQFDFLIVPWFAFLAFSDGFSIVQIAPLIEKNC